MRLASAPDAMQFLAVLDVMRFQKP